jgi:diguanylate cyclase (GGDEF)-like protein/PAS domain S-box-containing protein
VDATGTTGGLQEGALGHAPSGLHASVAPSGSPGLAAMAGGSDLAGPVAPDLSVAALRDLARRQAERITQLDTVIRVAPVGIGLVGMDGRTPLTNDTLRRLLGYSAEEFADLPFTAFTHPDDVEANAVLFDRMAAGEIDRFAMEKRFLRRDGSTVWADLTVSLVRDDAGRPDYAIGMTQDITERKRLADELHAAELHYRLLVEQVPAVVYTAEPGADGRWRYVSPQIERMLGYTPQEWTSDPTLWADRIHPEDRAAVLRHEAEVIETVGVAETFPSVTYRMLHRDGSTVWVRDDAMILRDADGNAAFHGVLMDVTQERELQERLAHMADHDPLTGLVNRPHFHRLVDEALAERARVAPLAAETEQHAPGPRAADGVAVLYVDLDGFKAVNDGFGHATGDRVLGAVAGRLMAATPPGGTAARLGGDEFAVLVVGAVDVAEAARRVAEAVLDVRVAVAGQPVLVRASVGYAVAERWHTTELLLHDADQAMYRAKLAGGAGAAGS